MPVTGTFTANVAASMLQRYPDISPYDMKPIPENVVPSYATANCKPANRSKLASYRLKNGVNAINIHGDNPYTVPQAEAPSSSLPLTEHRRVGSLTDAIVGDTLVFLEQVATSRNAISFKIRLGEEVRLIKIVSEVVRCPSLSTNISGPAPVSFCSAQCTLTGTPRVRISHG